MATVTTEPAVIDLQCQVNDRAAAIKGALLLPAAAGDAQIVGLQEQRLVEVAPVVEAQAEDSDRIMVALNVQ